MGVIKSWVIWITGVVAGVFLYSLIRGEAMDWEHMILMSVSGLIGIFIAGGIKKAVSQRVKE
ncbi:hypothetical protein ACFO3D_14155 [Virgibacillus kekensis]|uniref:Uncharacterized protein n=1 Tax=Virgibacillus kekensis TaxID=202261 RepID=A0ABV9DND4_9BACI